MNSLAKRAFLQEPFTQSKKGGRVGKPPSAAFSMRSAFRGICVKNISNARDRFGACLRSK
jgi:hypothetical protein